MRTRIIAIAVTMTAAASAALLATGAQARASGSPPCQSGCNGAAPAPNGWNIWSGQGSGNPASPGTAAQETGRSGQVLNDGPDACRLVPLPKSSPYYYPPPQGYMWVTLSCPAGNPYNGTYQMVPAATAAAAAVTPQDLLAEAGNQLSLPLPDVRTAPPRGSDGLVGLPEWFWADPAQWRPMSARVAVGGVWAQVTARPARMQIQPGTGASLACAGPGTPYNPRLAASGQQTSCSYTYAESSDGLPGNAYQASVTVTWTAAWQGSGGTGGTLPPLGRTTAFALPVTEAQALNPGS